MFKLKVSIITPVFNGSEFLEATIDSVISQTYGEWEMLLVDDVSTDNSWDVIQSFVEKDARIKGWRLPSNSGAAKARNFAIKQATGRFIAFLDDDDLWLPEKLQKQVEFSLANSAVITHTNYEYMDASGKRLGKVIRAHKDVTYQEMLTCNYIGCLTAMYDTDKIGSKIYMPDISKRQDYALWLNILRRGHHAYGLNEMLALYRTGGNSLSKNKLSSAMYTFKVLTEIEGISRLKAIHYFVKHLMLGIRKYYLS
ncbi:glycosyltransferase family 2 protein [Nitrospira sp. MA-1]|nr:glycosyltransferase family 2 protein [Nitrospira sp. MA-1]